MSPDSPMSSSQDRAGIATSDRVVSVYPAHAEPVSYGRGGTLVAVLVILLLIFLFFGPIWFWAFSR